MLWIGGYMMEVNKHKIHYLISNSERNKGMNKIEQLEKENAELKKQLDSIKKFSRDEVKKIIYSGRGGEKPLSLEEKVTSICNLMITEQDIIDVLEKYHEEIDKESNAK